MHRSLICAAVLAAVLPLGCEKALQTFDGNQLPTGLIAPSSTETLVVAYSQGSPARRESVDDGAALLGFQETALSVSYDAGTDRVRLVIADPAGGESLLSLEIPADRVTATLASGDPAPFSPGLKGIVSLDAEILGAVPRSQPISVPGCEVTVTQTILLHVEKERIEFLLDGQQAWNDTAVIGGATPDPAQSSCSEALAAQLPALQDPAVAAESTLELALERDLLDLSRIRFVREITRSISLVGEPGEAATGAAPASSKEAPADLPVVLDDGQGAVLRAGPGTRIFEDPFGF